MSPPSVVLVVLDSVRRDHLSCYGWRRRTTPNIDRIAGEGVRYIRATSTSCWTLPSHASLFTSLYPSEHRTDLGRERLAEGMETMASWLARHGYASASISANTYVSEWTALTRGFQKSVDVEALHGGSRGFLGRGIRGVHRRWRKLTRRDRGARRTTRSALEWLGRLERDQPFFLFLNYMDCHQPYFLAHRDRSRFLRQEGLGAFDPTETDVFAVMAGVQGMSATGLDRVKAVYDGCLYHLDRHVGRLDAGLQELNRKDDTIFIVTSDHGESFGEHGLLDHQYGLWEHLLAVPLVIRYAERSAPEPVDHRLVQLVDIFPTVADVVSGGNGVPEGLSGRSLLGPPYREASFAEYLVPNLRAIRRRFPEVDASRFDVALRSVSDGRFKLICGDDGRSELYDLRSDAGETKNIEARRPDVAARLRTHLERTLGGWPRVEKARPEGSGMEKVRDRLAALGYI